MKKTLSLLLSIFLLISLSSAAFAEGDTPEYNWLAVRNRAHDLFEGHHVFWEIEEVDALMWLPDIFLSLELTEEYRADNVIGFFVVEDSDAFVILTYSEMSGLTLDTLLSSYIQNGHDAKKVSVNGIPAVLDRNTEGNTLTLTYQTQDNMAFQVILSPFLDEHFADLYNMVIASIQPNVEEEEASEPVVPTNPVSSLISK